MDHYSSGSSSRLTYMDAVHGVIEFSTPGNNSADLFRALLRSAPIERLSRIKLLGYAADRFISANHSRYAHALGTMRVMRQICDRLREQGVFAAKEQKVCSEFGIDKKDGLEKHLLVAALLQDLGELPYGTATRGLYVPTDDLKQTLATDLAHDVSAWTNKQVFTICMIKKTIDNLSQDERNAIDLHFLVFLITGSVRRGTASREAKAIRHLLDGVVDADRLDYVFRDAHHTIGPRGGPGRVVSTLVDVDEDGPIFSEAGPVTDFLSMRSYLWSHVYLAPSTRFRTLLLRTVLMEIVSKHHELPEVGPTGQLSADAFLEFDDITIDKILTYISRGPLHNKLESRAARALEIIQGKDYKYSHLWISSEEHAHSAEMEKVAVPSTVFWDTYSDYSALQGHTLYTRGAIRIRNDRFKHLGEPIPLEKCSGVMSSSDSRSNSGVEIENGILLYVSEGDMGSEPFKSLLNSSAGRAQIYRYIHKLEDDAAFVKDTRKCIGFSGKEIFISFRRTDTSWLMKITRILRQLKQKYWLLYHPEDGMLNSSTENSVRAVDGAEALIVILSKNYAGRCGEVPNGPLAEEWKRICERRAEKVIPVVAMSVEDPESYIIDRKNLKNVPLPNAGKPLSGLTDEQLRRQIKAAVEQINSYESRP